MKKTHADRLLLNLFEDANKIFVFNFYGTFSHP